uniref:Uncharacterized protein n=1 Tax=Avena sativa TaxID=4498 RepID=A0ACD6ARW1_AVESA
MTRRTFNILCSLAKVRSVEDMSSYTFLDGRVVCLEDEVAIALIMLNSGEPPETVGSSVGVNQSTVLRVTWRFVGAVEKLSKHHLCWPDLTEMEKIKSMFESIHGLPNCCGVVDTTHITLCLASAEANSTFEKNEGEIHAVIDPNMRFTNFWAVWPRSMNEENYILRRSVLSKLCDNGAWLNGSKLKLSSDGSEIGEYIIGDAGYPLLPWLLTPYQENYLTDSELEFNRRHSAARTIALVALSRFKDTWRCLHRGMWRLENPEEMFRIIHVCCTLHNIMIDVEVAAVPRGEALTYDEQVRQLEDENAVRVRDILSQHFTSRSSESVAEEQNIVPSGSGVEEE